MIELNKYLNQFDVPTEIKMWIQSSLALGIKLSELLEIVKSDNVKIDIVVQDTIELIIATSRIKSLEFRYGSQNYTISNGILYYDGED